MPERRYSGRIAEKLVTPKRHGGEDTEELGMAVGTGQLRGTEMLQRLRRKYKSSCNSTGLSGTA